MIGIIDYGLGNLGSVFKAFKFLNIEAKVISNPEEIDKCEKIVLPGVGAFGSGMNGLRTNGFESFLNKFKDSGKPILGICLGLQFLFESSEESPEVSGLNWIPGKVVGFQGDFKIPHMGWNQVKFTPGDNFGESFEGKYFYFVHSYFVQPKNSSCVLASCDYFGEFVCGIKYENITAFQFHPEKSQTSGLNLLTKWVKSC